MKHPKHKLYKILSHADTYTWVQTADGTESAQKCFRLSFNVGSEVFLFEKAINIFSGHIRFELSVLNLYEVDKTYTFDIKDETDRIILVSNHKDISFPIPISFKEEDDVEKIELEVSGFLLDENKLRFKEKPKEFEVTDYSDFELGVAYDLPILNRYTNKNGNEHLVLSYKDKEYHAFIHSNYVNVEFGETVEVFLKEYLEGNSALIISRKSVIEKLYNIREKYIFTFIEHCIHPKSGLLYWKLEGAEGLINNYYPNTDITFNSSLRSLAVGEKVEMYVFSINKSGFLDLVYELKYWSSKQYIAEDLFSLIGYEDKEDEYFFNYFNSHNDEDSEHYNSFEEQYNAGNNLWVFSYLAFLDREINKNLDEGQYERAKELIDIYIKIEDWILEGSDYLTNFSKFKVGDIIQKAESKKEKLKSMANAMDLYLEGEDQEFLESILESLERSPYLNSQKKSTFIEFVRLAQYFSSDSEDSSFHKALLLIIQNGYLSDEDRWSFTNSIESKIYRLRNKMSEYSIRDATIDKKMDLKALLSNQYLLIVLYSLNKDSHKSMLTSVNLLRYLSIYHNKIEFVDLAIQLILRQSYLVPNILIQANVLDLSVENLRSMVKAPDLKPAWLRGAGRIDWSENGIDFTPKNLWSKSLIKSRIFQFGDFNLFVSTFQNTQPLSKTQEIQKLIKDVSAIISYRKAESEMELEYDKDKYYYGRVKSIHTNSYGYLSCSINGKEIETLIHVNTFHRTRIITELADILKIGDIVKFKIRKVKNDKIHISSADIFEEFSEELENKKKKTTGIVVQSFQNVTKVITEEGIPVSIFNNRLSEGDVLDLTLDSYNSDYHNFLANEFSRSKNLFAGSPAELFRGFLGKIGFIIKEDDLDLKTRQQHQIQKSTNKPILEEDERLKVLANFLINCLEQRLNFISDPIELIQHYFILIIISGIVKSHKSFIYNKKLNHLNEIIKLQYSEDIDLLDSVFYADYLNEEVEELKEEAQAFELIKFINSDLLDLPLFIEHNSPFYILKKLIETYNLLLSLSDDYSKDMLNQVKKGIIKELYNITLKTEISSVKGFESVITELDEQKEIQSKDKIITNLGSESKNKEFKSSLFFSASNEPQVDVILRTIAGFLNSYEKGGSLFIGVDDQGDIIGLKKDLEYSSSVVNLDQYQNHIQSLLVSAFPTEINALIDFKFHKSNHLDYLEIIIPNHFKPVPFENEFYQRQGVQTRILKGSDLVDFVNNKMNNSEKYSQQYRSVKNIMNSTLSVEPKNYSPIHQQILTIEENEVDYYRDLRKKGDVQSLNYEIQNDNLLAYLYLFEDNTYMVSSAELARYEFKIPITEKYRFGHLLMCYDNACVNKVEVRSIINRTFNKPYMNAKSNYGNLIAIFNSLPDNQLIIQTRRLNKSYLKIFDVDKISEHRGIGLKGNCIVQDDFDGVESFFHSNHLSNKFDFFRRESKQGLGAEVGRNETLFEELIKQLNS